MVERPTETRHEVTLFETKHYTIKPHRRYKYQEQPMTIKKHMHTKWPSTTNQQQANFMSKKEEKNIN